MIDRFEVSKKPTNPVPDIEFNKHYHELPKAINILTAELNGLEFLIDMLTMSEEELQKPAEEVSFHGIVIEQFKPADAYCNVPVYLGSLSEQISTLRKRINAIFFMEETSK